jgi:hypothetical protein
MTSIHNKRSVYKDVIYLEIYHNPNRSLYQLEEFIDMSPQTLTAVWPVWLGDKKINHDRILIVWLRLL